MYGVTQRCIDPLVRVYILRYQINFKVMKKSILKTWKNILAEVGRNEMLMMGYTLKK